jgi:microcystin-dependent protein
MANLAQYFQFSPATSFRMVNENPVIDPRYNNRSIDETIDLSNYKQPWQTNDINARIQVFTPYSDDAVGIYKYSNDVLVQNVPLTPINPPLLNQPFVCMNALPDFSSIGTGVFYIKYTYTDENDIVQDIRSSPLNIQVDQPNTMLYEYWNNTNDKSTIFLNADGSPVIFCFRVEAAIREPLAKNASEVYDDQYYNITNESYIPYDNYTNYIGIGLPKGGLPYWPIKQLNFVYSLDNVKIEGDYFASTGEEFKPTRPTNQLIENGYWAIAIQPAYAKNYQQYKTGVLPSSTFKVIELSQDYIGNTGNITINGLFQDGIELVGVALKNIGGDAITMVLSTNADGSNPIATLDFAATDPDSLEVDQDGHSDNVRHLFTAARTLYVSGLTGTNCDIHFRYINYNAPNYTPPDNGTKFVQNLLYAWMPYTTGGYAFSDCFSISTGLGVVGSDFENCVLAGVSGTPDMVGKLPLGWDRTTSGTLGVRTGTPNNLLTQLSSQVGMHNHLSVNLDTSSTQLSSKLQRIAAFFTGGGIARNYALQTTTTLPNAGLTSTQLDENNNAVTSTDPMNITPDSLQVAYFYYIKP